MNSSFKTANFPKNYKVPLYSESVKAGFPSPADDHIEAKLDLNSYLIKHPEATFLVRVSGDSMEGAGINPDDILIVDRSAEPVSNKIVVVALNGELTVKRLRKDKDQIYLVAENKNYKTIKIEQEDEFYIWGVVIHVIKNV